MFAHSRTFFLETLMPFPSSGFCGGYPVSFQVLSFVGLIPPYGTKETHARTQLTHIKKQK